VVVTTSGGVSNGVLFTVTLSITTVTLPTGTQDAPYSATLQAADGQPPYTWSSSGGLPFGLQLSASGAVTGTPIWSGTDSFPVQVTDATNASATANLSISVTAVPPVSSASSVAYTYDSQGRVQTAAYTTSAGTVTVTYSYDNAGNRTSVVTQ
jgi:YD repeat-containing protein